MGTTNQQTPKLPLFVGTVTSDWLSKDDKACHRINFNCSRLYCYQVVFCFFRKLTGSLAHRLVRYSKMTYFKSRDVNMFVIVAKSLVHDTAD